MSNVKSLQELLVLCPISDCVNNKSSEEYWVGSLSFLRMQVVGIYQAKARVMGTVDGINWHPITLVSHNNIATSHAQFDGIYGCHISCLDKIKVEVYDHTSHAEGGINIAIKPTHQSSIAYVIAA